MCQVYHYRRQLMASRCLLLRFLLLCVVIRADFVYIRLWCISFMLVWHAHNVVVLLLILKLRDIEFDPGENSVIATIVQIVLLQRSTHVVLPPERGERRAFRRLVLAVL